MIKLNENPKKKQEKFTIRKRNCLMLEKNGYMKIVSFNIRCVDDKEHYRF